MARRVVAQASFSWTCGPIHLLAPYETAASLPPVRAKRAHTARPCGVAAMPLHIATASGRQPFCGTTPLRAKRVLKGKRVIDKREKTAGCLPLARSAAASAAFPPARRGHRRCALQGEYERASARSFASLRMTEGSGGRMGGADGVSRSRASARSFASLRMTEGDGGRLGGADGIGLSRARAGFFAALRSAQNDKRSTGAAFPSPALWRKKGQTRWVCPCTQSLIRFRRSPRVRNPLPRPRPPLPCSCARSK